MRFPQYVIDLRKLLSRHVGVEVTNTDVQNSIKRLRETRHIEDKVDAFILGWLDERSSS